MRPRLFCSALAGIGVLNHIAGKGGEPLNAFSLKTELPKFREAGFTAASACECFTELRFPDTGALVCRAKNIVWSYPYFSVERNFERLCRLQQKVGRKGFVSDRVRRFLIVAQNRKRRESV